MGIYRGTAQTLYQCTVTAHLGWSCNSLLTHGLGSCTCQTFPARQPSCLLIFYSASPVLWLIYLWADHCTAWEVTPLLHHFGAAVQTHEGGLTIMPQPLREDDIVLVCRTLGRQKQG